MVAVVSVPTDRQADLLRGNELSGNAAGAGNAEVKPVGGNIGSWRHSQ
jgi:hypothetical protein